MENKNLNYSENPKLLEFISREFDKVAVSATLEELAEFAFGSIKEAIDAFECKNNRGKNENRYN